eukprot:g2044.t1
MASRVPTKWASRFQQYRQLARKKRATVVFRDGSSVKLPGTFWPDPVQTKGLTEEMKKEQGYVHYMKVDRTTNDLYLKPKKIDKKAKNDKISKEYEGLDFLG